ncbi:MAG: flagellar basal body L-ring protein FlgH [Phycisphaerae bacterium]|nr:flagellar basal body L-ring protein FlgH [Phycisphaerae bacterium]
MNRKKTALLMLFVLTAVINVQFVAAGSIFSKGGSVSKPLIGDDTAKKVGDILTILISEVTAIESKLDRKLEKSTSRSATFDGKLGIEHKLIPDNLNLPSFNVSDATSSSNKLDGKSEFKDEREVTDRVSVIVEDVQPNGYLVVIGKIQRKVADDKQTINLSGIVRPSDIKFDNTVKSEQVANFHMVIDNDGVSETYSKVGWIGKILDFIWPF